MERWEYMFETISHDKHDFARHLKERLERLNELGNQGWELITIENSFFMRKVFCHLMLKRRKQ